MHLAAGAGDGPVEVEDKYYYHQDNLGSTVMMTDESGQVVFEQDYTPFGQTLYQPGTVEKPTSGVEPGFGYTGQREEADIGLYYYNARYYDPEIGRFTREDEYQGDITRPQTLNLYSYVLQNPLKYVDPDGYSEYDWSMAMMYAMSPDPEASFNLDIEMKTTIISHTFRRIYDNVIFMGKEAYNFIAKPEETVNKYYDVTMNFIDVATSSAYYGITHPGDALEGYGMFFENIENNIEENPLWLAEKTGDLTGEILTNALLGYVGAKTVKLLDNITVFSKGSIKFIGNVDEIVEGTGKLSKSNIKHIGKHIPDEFANQVKYLSKEALERKLNKNTFFNPNWSKQQIISAVEEGYNTLSKQGLTGLQSYKVNGETIKIFIKSDGTLDSAYGLHKLTTEFFDK